MTKKLKFRRQGLGSRKKIKTAWRRPKGWASKQRRKIKGRRTSMPNIGYRSPKKERNEVFTMVSNPLMINSLKKGDLIIINGRVGAKKKLAILEASLNKGLIVKNYKKLSDSIKSLKDSFMKDKSKREKKLLERKKRKEEERKKREAEKKKAENKKKVVKIKKKSTKKASKNPKKKVRVNE